MNQKSRKHIVYDHPFVGMIVGLILVGLVYILFLGVINPLLGEDNEVAKSIAQIIFMMLVLLFHQFWFGNELKDLFKTSNLKKGILLGWSMLTVSTIVLISNLFSGEAIGSIPYAILCGIVPGVTEEVVFRIIPLSIAMRKLEDKKKLLVAGILTSLPFSVIHLANILVGADTVSSIIQMCYAFAIGLLLAGIYIQTKNMWAIVFLHSLQDIVSFVTVSSQQNGGVLVESVNMIEIAILLCFTIAFYINAFYVWRSYLKD